jgi:hypothetical protein
VLQSSIRSRWADQRLLGGSEAQSSGRLLEAAVSNVEEIDELLDVLGITAMATGPLAVAELLRLRSTVLRASERAGTEHADEPHASTWFTDSVVIGSPLLRHVDREGALLFTIVNVSYMEDNREAINHLLTIHRRLAVSHHRAAGVGTFPARLMSSVYDTLSRSPFFSLMGLTAFGRADHASTAPADDRATGKERQVEEPVTTADPNRPFSGPCHRDALDLRQRLSPVHLRHVEVEQNQARTRRGSSLRWLGAWP